MRYRLYTILAVLMTAGMAGTAPAEAPDDMAKRFGAREAVEQASLSPDGNYVALLQPLAGQGGAVYVIDLRGSGQFKPTRILVADGKPERIASCSWASAKRLLCTVFGMVELAIGDIGPVSRVLAIDLDGQNMKMLGTGRGNGRALGYDLFGGSIIDWSTGIDGHVLMTRRYVPEETVGSRAAQTKDGLGVDDVDSATLRSVPVERPRPDADGYLSDGRGAVRVMTVRTSDAAGYVRGRQRHLFRPKAGGAWQALSESDETGNGFEPHHVDFDGDLAYGLKRINGRVAAFSKSLDGKATENLLFAHPQVDVDGFVTIGRNHRTIGVTYVVDKREVFYFDQAMAKLANSLAKALPDLPLIRIVDASQDEGKLLLWAGSDTNAGRYFVLDRASSHMEIVTADRPQLEGVRTAQVKHVRYPAGDGTMIPAYLTLPPDGAAKNLPAIVMPHGGPEARDEWGFDWIAQFFASQGYAVLQPNFRGSAGYGQNWFQDNGFKSWRTAIGDVDDAGRWLLSEGVAAPDRLAIMGWSYGGYAALQSAVTEPGLFKAVIAVAPVTDLDRLREERRNWSNFALVSAYIGDGPHIEAGSPARHAAAFSVPVLMFHGTMDRNVSFRQSRLMDDRLKKANKASELVIYDGLDHYLQDSAARADLLGRSAAFLAKALHP